MVGLRGMWDFGSQGIDEPTQPRDDRVDVPGMIMRCRRTADLSQRDLAELLGVCPSTVARWETGDRQPDAVMLARIANLAGYRLVLVAAQGAEAAACETDGPRAGRPAACRSSIWLDDASVTTLRVLMTCGRGRRSTGPGHGAVRARPQSG